ncbi:MAG: tRNA lysidine(34) synthetase TilS [Clostridia bacterium]|nr:tRNA lysidine(34) synthetase TilS [Clostridia bacterium]
MQSKVLETIQKYNLIQPNDKVVIGVSGGPDSMSLLYILNKLKQKLNFEIVVAHINHMIREEADEETEYVKNWCERLNVKCYIKKINVIEKSDIEKIGTEEAGRKARYDFFEEVLNEVGANKIATAHNANDNAETVLMNIFRGSGTSGLKGIEPIRDGKYIRPIIECERQEIENYCEENNLQPKIDKSNFENTYTRNKIRNIIIPQIKKEFNPNIIESLNKLSKLASQENEFLDKYVINLVERELKIYEDTEDKKIDVFILDLKKFNQQERFIKSKVILYAIKEVMGTTQGVGKIHVDDIISLCEKNVGNKYLTPNKNTKVLVNKGKIYISKITRE